MGQEHAFKKGQAVKWNEERVAAESWARLVPRYGAGPFTVEKVRKLNTNCSCGSWIEGKHSSDCRHNAAEVTGHPQSLILAGFASEFSGYWFQPA